MSTRGSEEGHKHWNYQDLAPQICSELNVVDQQSHLLSQAVTVQPL